MSLPDWTAGVRVARAVAGISTGETDFEQLAAAVAEANRDRERDEEPQR